MLWLFAALLMAMWLLGLVTNYTLGGYLHVLLLLAIASVLVRIVQDRRPA